MSYQPKTWENKPSTASPINATNLNHMEGGIKTNDDNITDAQNAILTLQGEMLQAQGDISALETLVDSIFPVDTESGNPAVITDAFGGSCKSLKLTLEPIQSGSGTPSPSNVRPISGRTQSVVTRTGKNLVFKTISECNINASGTLESNNSYAIQVAYLKGGVTYTLTSDENRFVGGYFSSNPSLGSSAIGNTRVISNDTTITPTSDCWVAFRTYNNYATPQIEVGSTATTYEPYNGTDYTIQLGQTVYGGMLDVTTGVLTDKILYSVYDGSEDEVWGFDEANHVAYIQIPGINLYQIGVSNLFNGVITKAGALLNDLEFANAPGTTWVNIHYNEIDTLAHWKQFLSSNNLQIIYLKATPTTVQLTAEEVTLLKGNNVLTTDADNIEASYSADIALYIDKKISEGSNNRSVDNSSLTKGGSGDEEAKEEEKKEEIEIKEEEPLTKEVR